MSESTPSYRMVQTMVFDVGGRSCTDLTAGAAVRRATELGLGHIVVASTTGWTAERVLSAAALAGYPGQVVVVGEHTGYHGRGQQAMSAEARRKLEADGAIVFLGTHALSSVPRSFRLRWGGIDMAETVAETLRRISRGAKTCVEIAVMAADANLIPTDRDVVAMGGSGGGSDTAIVLRAANMNYFFDLKIREFVALPRLRVAEVLGPAIERSRQGAAAPTIAAELGVDPVLVTEYLDLHQRVQALQAQGLSLARALEQAGADGDVASTLRELVQP